MSLKRLLLLLAAMIAVAIPAFTQDALAQNVNTTEIGAWDGTTASLPLATPYENPHAYAVDFGIISYYNNPWRGYMDTRQASDYNNSLGVYWNVADKYAAAISQMYQESGIKYVRREIGWSNIGFDDQLTPAAKASLLAECAAWKAHGIRPLILLNANDGVPGPTRSVPVTIVNAVSAGATTVQLSGNLAAIRPGYTGFNQGHAGYPYIVSVASDGTATLSAPLSGTYKAGPYNLTDTLYQPFQPAAPINGPPCLAPIGETYAGWLKYVAAVAGVVKQGMGGTSADAGFDVEVWNELTFGSNFLTIANYYSGSQALHFGSAYTYTHTRPGAGLVPGAPTVFAVTGAAAILPMTVDYMSANYPGARVFSGFSNQTPYAGGRSLWPGQAGFSRHYYSGGAATAVSPAAPLYNSGNNQTTDISGARTGTFAGGATSIVPGSGFIPKFYETFPEFWESGEKTENLIRDFQPDSRDNHGEYGPKDSTQGWNPPQTKSGNHGRFTNNGDLHPALTIESETNWNRKPWMQQVAAAAGTTYNSAVMLPLDDWTSAKMGLRQYIFHASKGLGRTYLFNGGVDPGEFGMLPQSMLNALDASSEVDTAAVEATKPLLLRSLAWIHTTMSAGVQIDATCALSVTGVIEYKPVLVFKGQNGANLPDVTNKDLFAFLPYQLNARRYEIPYYVATLDVTHVWDSTKGPLDHTRYDMPAQQFDVTIANIDGVGASGTAYDPLLMQTVPVTIVAGTATTLTVRLQAVDYPRFLCITEAQDGPLIENPSLFATSGNSGLFGCAVNGTGGTFSLTSGQDWTTRSARTVSVGTNAMLALPPVGTGASLVPAPVSVGYSGSYLATIPPVMLNGNPTGMLAVRGIYQLNGLTCTWPRFDEDVAGQIATHS